MPTLQEILQDQNYLNANSATKKAIFDRWSVSDTNYTSANPATQQAIRSRFGVGEPAVEVPQEVRKSTIGSEIVRGGKQLASSIQTGAESLFGSPEEAARAGIARGEKIGEAAGEGVSFDAVKKAYEEKGLLSAAGEAISQVPRALAGQVPQLTAMAGGAKLGAMAGSAFGPVGTIGGGIVGAGATLLPQFFGSNVERQAAEQIAKGENVSIDRGRAGAAAAGQAALEGAGTAFTLGKGIVKGVLGITDDAALMTAKAQQSMKAAAERSLLQAAGRGAVKGAAVEMPVEVAQSVIERAQAGLDVTSPEAIKEYGEAAYQSVLVGGPLGTVGGATNTAMARQGVEAKTAFDAAETKRVAEEEQARLDAEAAEKAKAPPLALGSEGAFTPVALPDGSVAMTRDELAQYEEQQFRKKYEPQQVEQPPVPEPYVKPPSITGTKPEDLLTERKDALASTVSEARAAKEPASEVPLGDNYAFLQREKQRLLQEPSTPQTKQLLERIDTRIGEVLTRDIERQRADAEAAKTSVFGQKELPPVESRDVVVGGEALANLQARPATPDVPLTKKDVTRLEKMRETPTPPESDADVELGKLEKERSRIKSTNLYGELMGKLAPGEVLDISPDIGKNLRIKGGRGGAFISDIVSSGALDNYLPPDKRPDSITFDEAESTEYIKDKLRNRDNLTFDAGMQSRQLEGQIESVRKEANAPRMAEYEMSEVVPGEAASIERSAPEKDVAEAVDIRYQRSAAGGKSIGKDQTQSIADASAARWDNAPEFVVAESMDDPAIPQEVRDHNAAAIARGAKGSPKGFFYKGKAYILADAMTSPSDVMETLFHESLGHYGLRGTFGPKMEAVLRDVIKQRRAEVEAKAEQYGLDPKSDKDMLEAAEEVLAVMAQTKPGLPFVKRAIAVIRNFFRDLGFNIKMSDADIIEKYILPARAFVEKGERKVVEGKPAAMREEAPAEDVRYSRDSITGKPILSQWTTPTDTKLAGDIGKDDLIYALQNKMIDTKRVVDAISSTAGKIMAKWNPYLQEELYHGRTAKQTKDFLTDELRPLMQAMDKAGVSIADMETYLKNRHAIAYNEHINKINPDPKLKDKGSGISTADAQAYLNGLSPADKAKYEALGKRVDAITKGTRKLLVDSGYETKELIDTWEKTFPFYVPLKRGDIDYAYTSGGMGTGQGFDVRGSFSKRAMGSEREATDVLANIAMMRERAIVKAQKNRVAQALFGLAAQNPNPEFWLPVDPLAEVDPANMQELINFGLSQEDLDFIAKEPRQKAVDKKKNEVVERINATLRNNENVLSMRFNGENRYVFFNPNDPRAERMVKSLKNLDADQLGHVLGPIAKVTRWMAAVNTQYNPIFGAYNFLRDVQGAALQLSDTPLAKDKKAVVGGTLPALKGIYAALRAERDGTKATGPWADLWTEFQEQGGQTGFRDQFSRSQERAEALQAELNKIKEGKLKAAGRATFDWLSDYNDSMENAVRLSAYKAALDKGIGKEEAASIAKNLTVNFNRKGQIAVQAGALYAFFNAAMQGTTRLVQTLRGPAGKKIMAGGFLLGSMQAALLASAGFDEEEPPEFVRERNLILPIGDDKYIAFPMPLGYHVIPSTSRILTEWALSGFKDTPDRIASLTGMFLEAFNPIGNAGWSAQTLAPTFADPIVALTENRDWTGKPIARKDFSNLDPTPGYTRAKDTASEFSTQIAKFLNYASGGTEFKPGVLSPTPDQIDYLIGQGTGGLGREALKVEQTIAKTATGEELPPYKIPLVGRFYGETKSSAAESNRFYKNLTKLNEHENEIKGRREKGQSTAEYMAENPEARLAALGRKTYTDIQKLRKRKEQLVERDAPRESVQAVEKLITQRMQILNNRVKALEEN
jgi:hypothetical protein